MPKLKKRYYFLGGLPRSGSTLLCNILAQNPRIHATHTSGCLEVLFSLRNQWGTIIEHRAHPVPEKLSPVLQAVLDAYYHDVDRPVVVDKSRGWLSVLELMTAVLETRPKVIVPVRDVREVLASFERLWRKNSQNKQPPGEGQNYFQFQTLEGRCDYWARHDQVIGLAYNRIKDALRRGWRDSLHFVPFERLTSDPERELEKIYQFLGEEPFAHDFDHVEQVTWEDDNVHGFDALHTIRPKVQPTLPTYPAILGELAEKYAGQNFWEPLEAPRAELCALS